MQTVNEADQLAKMHLLDEAWQMNMHVVKI
jgi:hypothetical protein